MTPETFKQLHSTDWSSVGKRLLAFTLWRIRNYTWSADKSSNLTQGTTAQDIVQKVITKTISGERKWNPEEGPLEPWLKDQVKSVVDALYNSAPNLHEISVSSGSSEDDSDDSTLPSQPGIDDFASPPSTNPANILLKKESTEWAAQRINALFAAVSGEPELQQVLSAMMDGCEPKPRYLAEELGVSTIEINNRLKRLRRHALKLEKELDHAK